MDAETERAEKPARVLLVGEDLLATAMIVEMLRAGWPDGLIVTQAARVSDAVQELADHGATCVVLELASGAEGPVDQLRELAAAAPDVPIIGLSDDGDPRLGIEIVRAGAQDHMGRAELTANALARAIRYAVERKRAEVALTRQALHDPLTDLPNRVLLLDRLKVALDRSRRTGLAPAVMFLDVDSFKAVNDSLGHTAGDRLLRVLADRFRALLRPMDTVARVGGDEFTFLFEGLEDADEAAAIARRIADAARAPVTLGGCDGDTTVSASIGIAMITDPSASLDDAIRDADAAMYRAKDLGGARVELFDEGARHRVAARLSAQDALRAAITDSQLRIHYQPRVSISGRTGLVGFEALVRWAHPERGLIAPAEFVPLAEETGLIVPLGEWVIEQALRQVGRWRRTRPGMTISVNLSPRQLEEPRLAARLADTLRRGDVDPNVLCLEVAEEALVAAPEPAARALAALSEIGVRLAIDDCGPERSSPQALRGLPLDMLKIHQRFVSGPDAGAELSGPGAGPAGAAGDAGVAAVVDLGHQLGLSVVAEGVETDRQLVHLRELGCDGAQGFLFSRPVPESGVQELLAAR